MGAVTAVVLAEGALRWLAPVTPKRELRDGTSDLRSGSPEVLVLGSSHARTFHVLGEELERRRSAQGLLVAMPLENGKLVAYEWVLKSRVLPLIIGPDGTVGDQHAHLSRFVLVTEWWDSCRFAESGRPYWNLPGRAWALSHYLGDVLAGGVDSYNRNYLDHLYRRTFPRSVLVQSRGTAHIIRSMERRIAGQTTLRTPEAEDSFLVGWQNMVEAGANCIGDPEQLAAFRSILATTRELGLETTVVLFPRKPATVTERAAATTIKRFHDIASEIAAQEGARFIDLTLSTPLDDTDFMDDYDHVNAKGNQKFAQWALDNDLAFLMEPPDRP
jgi:hypothetical protein